jgi:hypothetical protein
MRGAMPPLPQYKFMAWCSVQIISHTKCVFMFFVWLSKELHMNSSPSDIKLNTDYATLHSIKIYPSKSYLYLKIYFHIRFYGRTSSGSHTSPTSEVLTDIMLLLLVARNYKSQRRSSPYYQDFIPISIKTL